MLEETEFGCIGSGIENANELKVLGFEEAMASANKADWQASVDHKNEYMIKTGVWQNAMFLKVLTSLTQHGQ